MQASLFLSFDLSFALLSLHIFGPALDQFSKICDHPANCCNYSGRTADDRRQSHNSFCEVQNRRDNLDPFEQYECFSNFRYPKPNIVTMFPEPVKSPNNILNDFCNILADGISPFPALLCQLTRHDRVRVLGISP